MIEWYLIVYIFSFVYSASPSDGPRLHSTSIFEANWSQIAVGVPNLVSWLCNGVGV